MTEDSNSKPKKHKYPDWRHPSLSPIKKNFNFNTEAEVVELFRKLSQEYPEISTLEGNRLSILIFNKVEPPKKPVQKYTLEIKKSKEEKFYVRYSFNNPKNEGNNNRSEGSRDNRDNRGNRDNRDNRSSNSEKRDVSKLLGEKKSAVGFYSELAVLNKERKDKKKQDRAKNSDKRRAEIYRIKQKYATEDDDFE